MNGQGPSGDVWDGEGYGGGGCRGEGKQGIVVMETYKRR